MAADNDRVLILAAHPDDEILGCGGTAALHTAAGDQVTSVIACEGESLRYADQGVGMEDQARRAGLVLGVHDIRFLRFPDQQLDTLTLTRIITPIEAVVRELRPRVVYCQYGGDVNRDHELLFKAILVATRPTESCIEAVYAFDTASSTEWAYPRTFVPDTWVDIGSTLERKLEAMACYASELRDYPHPRSLQALRNKARAWGNQCCLDAAEVFQTVRRVRRGGKTSG
ncbi:MAG TPA: PIG-L deacetylase family protein [Planctomycetota bacterium]|nr:PIG-L deacetylase family protein [Planctomycetota bacterium]